MDAKLNGGPAFPTLAVVGDTALSEGGLTVRDYFAAAAMQGICASGPMIADDVIAQEAYAIADAMLAARASGAPPAPLARSQYNRRPTPTAGSLGTAARVRPDRTRTSRWCCETVTFAEAWQGASTGSGTETAGRAATSSATA